ncbi:MAG: elongation factor G [Lachnospiraceae bacterium]|nr:elongation factor G [Lachnospiraceae bacterium]
MNVYGTDQIRNVVVLGHGGSGKTTLVEAIANVTGVTKRLGKVADGNTISDFDKEEQKRQFSISTTVVPIEYDDIKINFLDTPGYFDFVGEAEEACSAAGAAIIVINGKSGVEVGTQKAWDLCEKYNLPRMFFVTNMDDDQASFRKVVMELNELYGRKVAPFHVPMRENEKFVGFVNVVKMKGRRFIGNTSEYEECDIPDYLEKHLAISRDALMEAVAETSEEFMERYFSGEEFTYEEVSTALREHVMDSQIVPVLMGSGANTQGMNMLLLAIKKYFPSPQYLEVQAKDIATGEMVLVKYDETKHFSSKVFKTMVDPFIGKYSLIKVVTGVLKAGDTVYNVNKEEEARASKIYVLRGKEAIEVPELHAGDIGALTKIDNIATGDTIAVKGANMFYSPAAISKPYTYKAYRAKNKADEDKINGALAKMMEEDLTLKTVNDVENRQTLLYGIGDQQLEVVAAKMLARYKVEIELDTPRVAYRETIRKKVRVQGKHKKQSGGSGQYGDVHMEFEPSGDLDSAYVFEEKVVGGAVPKNYFPAVEKGIQECVLKGTLAGYPVVGLKATLVDGSYHPVDSSEIAFKMATILAYKKGFAEANPVLLEPIVTVSVTVPNDLVGDVMGDMNKRRGRVLGMDHIPGGKQIVTADVPMSEMFGYGTVLRAMTGGIGDFSYEFARYEQAPGDVQRKVVEAAERE